MNIVIADGLPASAIDILQQPEWNVDNRQGRPAAELMADLRNADALVVRSATKDPKMIARAKVRVIRARGTGATMLTSNGNARGMGRHNALATTAERRRVAMDYLSMATISRRRSIDENGKWEKEKFGERKIRQPRTCGLAHGQKVRRGLKPRMTVVAHESFHLGRNGSDAAERCGRFDDLAAR